MLEFESNECFDLKIYSKLQRNSDHVIFNNGSDFHTVFEKHFLECIFLESHLEASKLKVLRTIETNESCVQKRVDGAS